MPDMLHELYYALRQLRRSRVFALTAVLRLGLRSRAKATMWSVVLPLTAMLLPKVILVPADWILKSWGFCASHSSHPDLPISQRQTRLI